MLTDHRGLKTNHVHEGLIGPPPSLGRAIFKSGDENLLCGVNWSDLYPYVFALDPDEFLPQR